MMRVIIALALLFATPAFAEIDTIARGMATRAKDAGNITSGTIDVARMPAAPTWFDSAFCNTVGYIVARTTGGWVCSRAIPINVVWLGADPTGVSNSRTAFNNAVSIVSSGGSIYIPDGSYLISGGTVQLLSQSNVSIVGSGKSSSIILNGNTNAAAIQFGDNVTIRYGNSISNLTFAGASGITGVSGQYGLAVYKQGQFSQSGIVFTNSPSALYDGEILNNVAQATIYDLEAQSTTNNGVDLWVDSDLQISNSRSDANGNNGWDISGSQGLYFSSVTAWNNGTHAYKLYGTYGNNFNMFFSNCIGDTSKNNNWQIENLFNSSFINVWGSTQSNTTSFPLASGFNFYSSNVHHLNITNLYAIYNNLAGVVLGDPTAGGTNNSGPHDITIVNGQYGTTLHPNGRAGYGYGIMANGNSSFVLLGGRSQGNTNGAISISNIATYSSAFVDGINGAVGVSGNQVVGARQTGWGAPTGTLDRTALAAYGGQTVSAGYVQAEAQATDNACKKASQELGALITDLRTHGLIGN